MSSNAITQPIRFGRCYLTDEPATQMHESGRAVFPISELGLTILRAEEVRPAWRLHAYPSTR